MRVNARTSWQTRAITQDSYLVPVTLLLTLSPVFFAPLVHSYQPKLVSISLLSATWLQFSWEQLSPFPQTSDPQPEVCELDDVRRRRESVIRIGVILPMYDTDYAFSLMYTRPAFEIAREQVHARSDLLDNYTIEFDYRDSICSDVYGPLEGIEMYARHEVDLFIGPFCDYAVAPLARFTSYWDIPIITAGGLVHALNDKTMYNLLTRMVGSYTKLAEYFLSILDRFKWYRVGMLLHQSKDRNAVASSQWFTVQATFLLIRDHWNPNITMEYARTFDMKDYTEEELEDQLLYLSRLCRGERARVHNLPLINVTFLSTRVIF
ncbi:guanylate cyclase [Plakobranchus ocellatus]|uniref:Guanylate cyclase n=1 Tax=Plakobranchus ocellatus TaxID=259542 RepID=A0AAV4DF50_9GAST|nr:guanylate cyclase [Plakobranchus ocellatus]